MYIAKICTKFIFWSQYMYLGTLQFNKTFDSRIPTMVNGFDNVLFSSFPFKVLILKKFCFHMNENC